MRDCERKLRLNPSHFLGATRVCLGLRRRSRGLGYRAELCAAAALNFVTDRVVRVPVAIQGKLAPPPRASVAIGSPKAGAASPRAGHGPRHNAPLPPAPPKPVANSNSNSAAADSKKAAPSASNSAAAAVASPKASAKPVASSSAASATKSALSSAAPKGRDSPPPPPPSEDSKALGANHSRALVNLMLAARLL